MKKLAEKRLRKWKLLRIPLRTHKLLAKIKARAGLSMSEVVSRIIDHLYTEGPVQALAFFLVYLDGKPYFIVASKDAETAVIGMRKQLLGAKPAKLVTAVAMTEAPQEDVLRVGVAAIMTQLSQLTAVLGSLAAAQGARN